MKQKQILRKIGSYFSILILTILLSCSQKIYLVNEVDEVAQFPFGKDSLSNFLSKNIRWVDGRASGKGYIIVAFTVKANGKISDIKIDKNLFFNSFEKEAIRVVEIMPKWIPARKNNKNISSKLVLPIKFEITD